MRINKTHYRYLVFRTLGLPIPGGNLAVSRHLRCDCRTKNPPHIDAFGTHAETCIKRRYPAHNAVQNQLARMLTSAGFKVVLQPVGLCLNPTTRPDLVVSGTSNKDILIDVTTVAATRQDLLLRSSSSPGLAAQRGIDTKIAKYSGNFDTDLYDFLPISIETSGRPSKQLSQLIKMAADNVRNMCSAEGSLPRIYASQFAFRWTLKIITVFKKSLACGATNHLDYLFRNSMKRRYNMPYSHDEIYYW